MNRLIDEAFRLPLPGAEFRAAQRLAVDAARSDPDRWPVAANADGSTYRYDSHAVQLRLAGVVEVQPAVAPVPDVSFSGRVIHVSKPEPGTRPPEMDEFHALALAKAARVGVMRPGDGKDAMWLRMEREHAEGREKAVRDAIRLQADPILRSVADATRDDDDGW